MPEAGEHHCAICLQPLTARLTLDGCEHAAFCRKYIEQWGRSVANTCPLCRSRFSVVTVQRAGAPAVAISIPDRECSETDYYETSEDDDTFDASDDGSVSTAVGELLSDVVRIIGSGHYTEAQQAAIRPVVIPMCVAFTDVVIMAAKCCANPHAASLPDDDLEDGPLDMDPALACNYLMRPLEHLVRRCCSDSSAGHLAVGGRMLTGSEAETMALMQRLQIAAAFSNHAVREFRRLTSPPPPMSRMEINVNDCADAVRRLLG